MKIGVVGAGMVGGAVIRGMNKLEHNVFIHDLKMNTKLSDVLLTDICYLCVPTPAMEDGKCDTSVVEATIQELKDLDYQGIIAIKSTVAPGTTQRMIDKYQTYQICFVPEFLRERYAVADFIEYHDVCAIGTFSDDVYNKVKQSHGHFPKYFFKLLPTEAELLKYMNNVYNATLVTLANSFYEVSKHLKTDYAKVKNALVHRNHIYDMYLDCNENLRGYSGMCLLPDAKVGDINGEVISLEKLYKEHDHKRLIESTDEKCVNIEYKTLKEVTVRQVSEELYVFRTSNGTITCTKDHYFPILRDGNLVIIQAKDIKESDQFFAK